MFGQNVWEKPIWGGFNPDYKLMILVCMMLDCVIDTHQHIVSFQRSVKPSQNL